MTQNSNRNVNENLKKQAPDPTTYTAYGDPLKNSSPNENKDTSPAAKMNENNTAVNKEKK